MASECNKDKDEILEEFVLQPTVAYVYRCFAVDDDEELQVGEPNEGPHEDIVEALKQELPAFAAVRIIDMLNLYFKTDESSQMAYAARVILETLPRFIPNKSLCKFNFSLWQDLMFEARGEFDENE